MVKTSDLIKFLKSKTVNSGFMDQLKVSYRPLISPFDSLINELQSTTSIFDIGCGSGQFALLLAEFTHVKKIGGIEIEQKLVTNAIELLKPFRNKLDYRFDTFDGKTLPSLSGYEVILLIDVLHHVPAREQLDFLQSIFNVMEKGSLLIIKDIDASSPFVYFNKMHDLIFASEIGNEWKLKKLIDALIKIGFKVTQVEKKQIYVYPHYTIKLEK